MKKAGLYNISALAAGATIQAAETGCHEPAFALVRPPGHHASAGSSWGFCYFNNMAVALCALKDRKTIETAFVLDFDLHFGDGNVNILGGKKWVKIHNPNEHDRGSYLRNIGQILSGLSVDIIGISAGFDHHIDDWGGLLETEDYRSIGMMIADYSKKHGAGVFAVLEGGYNHAVLGKNVAALLKGLSSP